MLSLQSAYCLGVEWSPCGDGHFNRIVVTFASSGWAVVSVLKDLCNNMSGCYLRVDNSAWCDLWSGNWSESLSAGTHTFLFWSKPTNRNSSGNTAVLIWQGSPRYFGWENRARVDGDPGDCPDPDCP